MTTKPLISVIINAYNGEKFLREAIESVYAQTQQDFEIVFFDDASTDSTAEIAKSFDSKLKYHRSDTLIPLGAARNRAMELCRGTFLSFLDQDDIYLPCKLERQIAAFRDDVGLVYSNSIRLWTHNGDENILYNAPQPEGMAFRSLLQRYTLTINTVMIRRDVLPADQHWWFMPNLRMCEEQELFLRLSHAHAIAYIDEPLAKYRIHGENYSIRHREVIAAESAAILERLAAVIPDFATSYSAEIATFRANTMRVEAQLHWKEGRRLIAWRKYGSSLMLDPRPICLAEFLLSIIFPYAVLPRIRELIGRPI